MEVKQEEHTVGEKVIYFLLLESMDYFSPICSVLLVLNLCTSISIILKEDCLKFY